MLVKRFIQACLVIGFAAVGCGCNAVALVGAAPVDNDMVLWYDRPAEKWVEALPVGNGTLGGMIFGGVAQERALLFHLVRYAWDARGLRHRGVYRLLQGGSGFDSFKRQVAWIPSRPGNGEGMIDKELADSFVGELLRDDDDAQRLVVTRQDAVRERADDLRVGIRLGGDGAGERGQQH